jgi:hypothetical protein
VNKTIVNQMTSDPSLIGSENADDSRVDGDEPVYHILSHAQDESCVETEPRGTEPLRDGSLPSTWATIPRSNAHAELASTYAFLGFRALPVEQVF